MEKTPHFVSPCHEAASKYLQMGWSVLPFCSPDHIGCGRSHGKRCQSPGKTPLVGQWDQWKIYQKQRIPSWLLDREFQYHTNANVGLVLGEISGLVGLDVDGPAGREVLIKLSQKDIPKTLAFQTGRGFRLLYALSDGEVPPPYQCFHADGDKEGRVEILGNGRCTVLPPSRHENGKSYAWVIGFSPDDRRAVPLPNWLQSLSQSRERQRMPAIPNSKWPIREFRNVRLFRIACSLRRQGADSKTIFKCLDVFNKQCVPPLEQNEIIRIAKNSLKYAPAPYEYSEKGNKQWN